MTRIWSPLAATLGLALSLNACVFTQTPVTPMVSAYHAGFSGDGPKGLLVMLPGLGDSEEDFTDEGFIADLAGKTADWDAIAVDSNFGYYREGILVERLHADIIEPARAAGYERIWIVGISLGGLGAISYAQAHPDSIEGVLLLAPYLGQIELHKEIGAAGGLADWDPKTHLAPDGAELKERHLRKIWGWLRGYTTSDTDEGLPSIYISYGAADDIRHGAELLSPHIPEAHTTIIEGNHKWVTWRPLFNRWVDAVLMGPTP